MFIPDPDPGSGSRIRILVGREEGEEECLVGHAAAAGAGGGRQGVAGGGGEAKAVQLILPAQARLTPRRPHRGPFTIFEIILK
jgi:hypothetical protein